MNIHTGHPAVIRENSLIFMKPERSLTWILNDLKNNTIETKTSQETKETDPKALGDDNFFNDW